MKPLTKDRPSLNKRLPIVLILLSLLFLMICACSSKKPVSETCPLPPEELLAPIKLPSREKLQTVGDMARIIMADETVILLKNADLQALREWRTKIVERQ